MKNHYEIREETAVIFLNRRDGTKLETIIDINDFKKVNEFPNTWCVSWYTSSKSYYVYGSINILGKRKIIYLHRFLMATIEGLCVDHINHDTLDNRLSCNLRNATASQNQQNSKGSYSNSKSGIRGVCWNNKYKKWQATIRLNKKSKHLGFFLDLEEADRVVKEARAVHMPYSEDHRKLAMS